MLPGVGLLLALAPRGFPGCVVLLRFSSLDLGIRRLLQSRIFSRMCGLSSGPSNKFSSLELSAPGGCNGAAELGCLYRTQRLWGEEGGSMLGGCSGCPDSGPPALLRLPLPGHCRDAAAPYAAATMGKEVFSPSATCLLSACMVPHRPSLRASATKLPLPLLSGAVTRC